MEFEITRIPIHLKRFKRDSYIHPATIDLLQRGETEA